VKPTSAAAEAMAFCSSTLNGIVIEIGIDRTFLSAMQALASKGSPGAAKTGMAR
jgi:hypothetical protein